MRYIIEEHQFRYEVDWDTLNKEEDGFIEEHFPSESAARCVPQEASGACSTAIALEWDKAWQGKNDPSGRAVAGVHDMAYEE